MITPEHCIAQWEAHKCDSDNGICTHEFGYNCEMCGKLVIEHGEAIPGNMEYGFICVSCYYEDAAKNTVFVAIPAELAKREDDSEIPF
jgi:hypothetical protein